MPRAPPLKHLAFIGLRAIAVPGKHLGKTLARYAESPSARDAGTVAFPVCVFFPTPKLRGC